MYTRFNKEQAKHLRRTYNHLIGEPFDDELSITNLWVIPTDQDMERIMRMYQFEGATSEAIADRFGNGQNLYVLALSSDLIREHMPILPHQDIAAYLSEEELQETLAIQENDGAQND